MSSYEQIGKVISKTFTQQQIEEFVNNPVETSEIYDIIEKATGLICNSNNYQFSYYEKEDIYQQCWMWTISILKAGKYSEKYSLFGYLYRVYKNKLSQLKRDKQWRYNVADQRACSKCRRRKVCDRRILISDLNDTPKCKVMTAALRRNNSKYLLSLQMDDEITDRVDNTIGDTDEILEVFYKYLPDKYIDKFNSILENNTKGIKKKEIRSVRKYCFRIANKFLSGDPIVQSYIKHYKKVSNRENVAKFRKRKRKAMFRLKNGK